MEYTHEKKFLPSRNLAKDYLRIEEEVMRKKSSERDLLLERKIIEEITRCYGAERLSYKEEVKAVQGILGKIFFGKVVGYTKRISEDPKDVSGLVVKLTENNSFNKEFVERFEINDSIDHSYENFFSNLHNEFRDYLKENSMKLVYAKVKVNEKDEIEFFDFKKYDYPSFEELTEGNWV